MTEADPNAIGPDGTVRLRCYLPLADSLWFFAGCQGRQGCGHVVPIGARWPQLCRPWQPAKNQSEFSSGR